MAVPQSVIDAVAALDLRPRRRRWTSLSYCLVDAVWSIGANYDTVVVPVVRRVAARLQDPEPVVELPAPMPPDPAPISKFLEVFPEPATLLPVTNRQRTSTRRGVTKAQAAVQHAQIFHRAGIENLEQAAGLLADDEAFAALDETLKQIAGEGGAGIRRGYLWMLIGDDYRVKPDRMVLRWLKRHGVVTDPAGAAQLLLDVAAQLATTGSKVTPWMIDHAIWLDARRKPT